MSTGLESSHCSYERRIRETAWQCIFLRLSAAVASAANSHASHQDLSRPEFRTMNQCVVVIGTKRVRQEQLAKRWLRMSQLENPIFIVVPNIIQSKKQASW